MRVKFYAALSVAATTAGLCEALAIEQIEEPMQAMTFEPQIGLPDLLMQVQNEKNKIVAAKPMANTEESEDDEDSDSSDTSTSSSSSEEESESEEEEPVKVKRPRQKVIVVNKPPPQVI